MEKQILLKVTPEFKKLLKIESANLDVTMKDFIIKSVNYYVLNNTKEVK